MPQFLTDESGQILTDQSGQRITRDAVYTTIPGLDIQAFDFSVNLLQAILWEYNDAVNLQELLAQKAEWYNVNQTQFWENWLTDVFDLRTANDFGLTVWSIILRQPIYVTQAQSPTSIPSWGFGAFHRNFNRGNFFNGSGSTFRLPTETARLVLQLRYFQLTSSGTVPETNRMLQYMFGSQGNAYLVDNHDMTQTYVFDFVLPSLTLFVLRKFDILPRPAGVYSSIA